MYNNLFILLFLTSRTDSRAQARLLPQRLSCAAGSHLEFHQNSFANGRERPSILWTSNIDESQHAVSSDTSEAL